MSASPSGVPSEDDVLEVPVLVVGGGPAGLTAALELARRGVDGLLIEKRGFDAHFPRAHLLNVRTMEVFADVGVAGQVYAESPPEDRWHKCAWYTSLAGPTPLHGRRIGDVPAWGGGADAPRYAAASPRRFANLPQLRVDAILAENAARAWPDRVRARHELVGLVHDADGATATVLDRDAATTYRVRARYVVAADGGRTCAGLLGVGVSGPRALLDIVSVYFAADLSAHADPEALLTYFVSPAGQGSFAGALLGLGPGRWGAESPEWSMGMAYRIGDPTADDREAVVRRVREILGLPDLAMEVKAVSHWQFEGVVADRFRVGPVFLAGDAAHRHPPTGGLGLNTAIGDVSNLAWKLAAVVRGEASPALLDTYEPERMPVAARNVEHSLRNAGRHRPVAEALGLRAGMSEEEGWAEIARWAEDSPEGERRRAAAAVAVAHNAEDYSQLNIEAGFAYRSAAVLDDGTPPPEGHGSSTDFTSTARPGHHVPHAWLTTPAGERVSTSDVVAPTGLTLFVDASGAVDWAAAARDLPVRVVEVGPDLADTDGRWAADSGTTASGAVLVRPDRHVAWRTAAAPAHPAAELERVVDAVLHPAASAHDAGPVLDGIAEAGEALRTGTRGGARLFSVVD
ncbi:FAD-dependent monooxygenase [Pseudonocardia broussonetiae]|uniref:FAD-dependent monooxygenase n=1 Tax=Pseudonocardia broussonetiae TaxID=2736640 RepID=UPI0019665AF1|nr:FAD-dependent monooxygenase [Pseudonocardia broussonetiae]